MPSKRLRAIYHASLIAFSFTIFHSCGKPKMVMYKDVESEYYSFKVPSEWEPVDRFHNRISYSFNGGKGSALISVMKPIPDPQSLKAFMDTYTSSQNFLSQAIVVGGREQCIVNKFSCLSVEYQGINIDRKCRVTFIQGPERVHILEYCTTADNWAKEQTNFNFLRANITRVK